jgi:hypothetical protein
MPSGTVTEAVLRSLAMVSFTDRQLPVAASTGLIAAKVRTKRKILANFLQNLENMCG